MADATVLGADPAHLDELATAFAAAAGALDRGAAHLDALVRGVAWTGPGAAAFRAAWTGPLRQLRLQAASCRRSAARLRRAAQQQRQASRSGAGRPARRAVAPPRRPLHESVVTLRGTVHVGPFLLAPAWSARMTELEHRRTRIVVSDTLGLAVGAGAGGLVEVGCGDTAATPVPSMARRAEVAGGVGVEHRDVMEVPDEQVHRALLGAAATRAAAVAGIGPLASLLARGAPRPTAHEVLVHGTVSAAATVSVGGAFGPGAGATSAADLAVGRGVDADGRPATVLELTSTSAAAVHLGVLQRLGVRGPRLADATWVRIEVPDRPARAGSRPPVRIEVRATGTDGRTARTVATVRTAPGRGARAALAGLHLDLRAGRRPGAAALDRVVTGLVGNARLEQVQTEVLAAEVQGCHVDAVGGTVATVGLGAAAQVVNLGPAAP